MKKFESLAIVILIVISTLQVVFASEAYAEEQAAIIDDFYNYVIERDSEVSIQKDDIWCSEKSAFGTYLIVCKAQYGSIDIYLTARYETNSGKFQMYSMQSSFNGLLQSEMEVEPMENESKQAEPYLQFKPKAYALAMFPDADVRRVHCSKLEKDHSYMLISSFRVDDVLHAVSMYYEFQGDGEFYRDEDFHLFEVRVDGELMFEEERIFD